MPCLKQLSLALAGGGVHRKGHMAHPQTWMAALLDVSLRSAEPADEEVAQPLLGAREIVRRVHDSENVVARHLAIKAAMRRVNPSSPMTA